MLHDDENPPVALNFLLVCEVQVHDILRQPHGRLFGNFHGSVLGSNGPYGYEVHRMTDLLSDTGIETAQRMVQHLGYVDTRVGICLHKPRERERVGGYNHAGN